MLRATVLMRIVIAGTVATGSECDCGLSTPPAVSSVAGDGTPADGNAGDTFAGDSRGGDARTGDACAGCWWDGAWGTRVYLGLEDVARTVSLRDFPLLVTLSEGAITGFDYADLQSAGEDLRFIDSDGNTVLDHEIEAWDATGASYVWVRVPELEATDAIWMYYGNPSVGDGQVPQNVWTPAFAGVWHLGESSGTRLDSTQNGNHLTESVSVSSTPGKVGIAADFGSSNVDRWLSVAHQDQTGLDLADQLTVEVWLAPAGAAAMRVVSKNGSIAGDGRGYELRFEDQGASSYRVLATLARDGDCTLADNHGDTSATASDAWTYLVAVYDGAVDRVRLYGDGALIQELDVSLPGELCSNTAPFVIGARSTGQDPVSGAVDEVRVSNVARSADWIGAQHRSMTDGLIVYGGVERL